MTPDPILAALGGNITAARTLLRKRDGRYFSPDEHAIYDLALRALDAMEWPAGGDGDAKLWELRDHLVADEVFRHMNRHAHRDAYVREIDRLLSEPAPASDGRTGSCAECERLNADVLAYRRKERKILGLPDEALAEDHIDAITSLKNAKDGWEAECEMQRVTKQRIIAERDEARAECERLMAVVDHIRDNYVDGDKAGDHEGVIQCVDRLARERAEARAECVRLARARDLAKVVADYWATRWEGDHAAGGVIDTLTRERDEARADQAAMARRELEAFGSDTLNLRALPADAPVQVVRDIIAEKLRARLAALPAEKPAEPAEVFHAAAKHCTGEMFGEQAAVKPAEPANPPASPAAGDWPEDGCHENGAYQCVCIACGATFIGHKRRVVCKVCSEKPAERPDITVSTLRGTVGTGVIFDELDNPPASPGSSPADAEARIAAWERHAMSGFDPHHDAVVVLAPSEVDSAVALMRSLAADNAKAQAEVERLRDDVDACRRAYSAHWVDDYDTAQECMAAAVDSAMILRGKLAEAETAKLGADSFRAKLREELARASQVEADLRTQLVVMENNLVRSLRGGGK